MISYDGDFRVIDVHVKMLTRKQDAEGFSFCLGIRLFYGGERATGMVNNMVVLAEVGAKTNRMSIDDDGELDLGGG